MEPIDGDYIGDGDTRNVKGTCGIRRKRVGMVTKAYSAKAVQKIQYAKEERFKAAQDKKAAEEEKARKAELDEYWADPVTDKKMAKKKEKDAKAEEKMRKKLEKMELAKSELNGHAKSGKKKL